MAAMSQPSTFSSHCDICSSLTLRLPTLKVVANTFHSFAFFSKDDDTALSLLFSKSAGWWCLKSRISEDPEWILPKRRDRTTRPTGRARRSRRPDRGGCGARGERSSPTRRSVEHMSQTDAVAAFFGYWQLTQRQSASSKDGSTTPTLAAPQVRQELFKGAFCLEPQDSQRQGSGDCTRGLRKGDPHPQVDKLESFASQQLRHLHILIFMRKFFSVLLLLAAAAGKKKFEKICIPPLQKRDRRPNSAIL